MTLLVCSPSGIHTHNCPDWEQFNVNNGTFLNVRSSVLCLTRLVAKQKNCWPYFLCKVGVVLRIFYQNVNISNWHLCSRTSLLFSSLALLYRKITWISSRCMWMAFVAVCVLKNWFSASVNRFQLKSIKWAN